MDFPAQRVDVGGLTLAYRRAGEGRPLVLLHGAYEDSRIWWRQLSDISADFDVIAWDAPGFGLSDDPPEGFSASDYGDCLADFVAALNLDRPHVLGLSFGSVIALTLWQQRPDVPASLVLAAAYAGWAGSLPREEVERRLGQAREETTRPADEFIPRWLPSLLTPDAPSGLADEVAELMRDFHPAGMRSALVLGDVDLRPALPTITVPTLLLYGDRDVRSPADTVGADLKAAIPRAQLVVLPDAPHLSMVETPDAFNDAVRTFLQAQEMPDPGP